MKDDAQKLLSKYKLGTCTPEEEALINNWYAVEVAKQQIPEGPADPLEEEQLIWAGIKAAIPVSHTLEGEIKTRKLRGFNKWIGIAASLILLLAIGVYSYHQQYSHEAQMAKLRANDIKPGGKKAVLTLASGKKIVLTDALNGALATEGGVKITKTGDGQLEYTVSGTDAGAEGLYNTIETPRGGQYLVHLPDGTSVWLNAMSSLTFPTVFTGNRRLVRLKGEGYFEVAKLKMKGEKKKPFVVVTNQQTVLVYGTHFNVNSYADEGETTTTLLEGSVSVSSLDRGQNSKTMIKIVKLNPGQQAEFSNGRLKVQPANAEEAIAWKNGKFKFTNENIESLMRKVSRWYDVEVEYRGNISKEGFGGQVS
ncbi:MAG: DUF4974 domain-containing protein, partial [Pedobacter sp.]